MKKIILDVKPFQETLHAHMCGPASLKIVADYYGIKKSEQDIVNLTGFIENIGIHEEGIVQGAKALGLKTFVKNESTFDDIEKWLSKDIPMIVDWFTRGRSDYSDSEIADGHYSVIIGLDDKYVYIQDPEIGGVRKIKRDDFMLVWFDFRGHTIKPDELIIRQLIAIYK